MLRLAVTLAVPVLVAFALAAGATRIIGSEPQQSTWTPWGNRVASSPAELASWLAARGSSYGDWARKHPAAAARLEGRPVATAPSGAAVQPESTTVLRDVLDQVVLTVMVVLLTLLALALVLVGARRVVLAGPRFPRVHDPVGPALPLQFYDARMERPHREARVGGRAVEPVEQKLRMLRWFYRNHRDEILWLGLGSVCAVVASLAITL
jgi:hypothetical protein